MNDMIDPRRAAWDAEAPRRRLVADGFCHVPCTTRENGCLRLIPACC